ncbi:MAG: hypothetical protein RIB67_01845 [Miltoncostaeaceae bacterium]
MRAIPLSAAVILLAAAHASPASAAWSSPHVAGPSGTEVRAPAVARSPAGDVMTVWVRVPRGAGPGSGQVMVRSRPAQGTWGPARRLSGPGTGAPAAAIAPDGSAAVAFGIRDVLHVARRQGRRGPWRVERVASGNGHVVDVRIALDARRRITVAWSARSGDAHVVRTARRGPRASGRWAYRGDGVVARARPAIEVAADGRALASWAHDGSVHAVPLGGLDPAATRLGSGDDQIPSLALAPGGRAVVGWRVVLPGGSTVVTASERGRSGAWRSLGDLGVGSRPEVAIGPRGDAAVVWPVSDSIGERAGIDGQIRSGTEPWRATPVVARAACECRYVLDGVAVDGRGGPLVVWHRVRREGGGVVALSARAAAGGPWRSVALRPPPSVGDVALGVDRVAGAALAWSPARTWAAGPLTRLRAGAR